MNNKLIIFAVSVITIVSSANANHTPKHIESDEINYKERKDTLGISSKNQFPDSYANDPIGWFHLYGYLSSSYEHNENPYHYTQETINLLNTEKEDNYSTHQLYLINAIEFSENIAWRTTFDGINRFYENYNELDDSYIELETGPSFLFRKQNTKISAKFVYGNQDSNYKHEYESFGGLIKMNYFGFRNFNSTLNYYMENRNYNMENTDETNRYVHEIFFVNRFTFFNKHLIKITPVYQYHQTQLSYQDKSFYSTILNYTYFPKSINFYFGGGYEYSKTVFKDINPTENYKKRVAENKYSLYVGYNFAENLNLQFTYSNDKISTNHPNINSTSYDNTLSLGLVYKFHLM